MKTAKILFIAGIIVAIFLFYYFHLLPKNHITAQNYKITNISKGNIEKSIILTGQIRPSKVLSVNTPISGKILEKKYRIGDFVNKNQELIIIQPDEEKLIEFLRIKQQFLQAKFDLEKKNREYSDLLKSYNKHFTKKDDLIKSKNDLELAKIAFEINKRILNVYQKQYGFLDNISNGRIDIKAPVSGIIIEDNVSEGNYIKSASSKFVQNTDICKIGFVNVLKVKLSIDEEYVDKVHSIKKITLTDNRGRFWGEGKIEQLIPVFNDDKENITFDFYVLFPEPDFKYYLGTSVNAKIVLAATQNCLKIPLTAVKQEKEKFFVEILSSEGIKRKEVSIGIIGDRFLEITKGLRGDEKIILRNSK